MIVAAAILIASGLFAASSPTTNKLITRDDDVRCGTTQDATLSACQSILDNWTGELVWSNTCSYGGFIDEAGGNTAYNVASVPGCTF